MDNQIQTCFKCKKALPLSDFYVHRMMANGHLGKCKACTRMDTKKRADALKVNMSWVQKEKARCREKASRFRKLYPEKYAARDASAGIPKTKGFHNHHWSYNTEHRKDVISMSAKDHVLVHRYTVYDQERAMYRRLDGTLIDSREAAIAYYSTLKD
jgi:hypothetical protein